jgi:FKBP-type peptidyl-prolyl cis-trans isomerase FkpA
MKKYLLLFSLIIIGLSACDKNEVATQATIDDAKIQAYIKANNITDLTKDPSGIYYKVMTPGTGPNPVYAPTSSTVQVAYSFTYLDGQTGQSASDVSLLLSSTVLGFQIALTHINQGGRLYFIIPSNLGYGSVSNGAVPPNAVLIYTLDLIGFY